MSRPLACSSLRSRQLRRLRPGSRRPSYYQLNIHIKADSTRADLVKIEDQIQFADIPEKTIEDLDEEVDGLEICQLIVVGIDASAEEETSISAVHDLCVAKFDKVRLVLLISGRYEAVHVALELDLLIILPSRQ